MSYLAISHADEAEVGSATYDPGKPAGAGSTTVLLMAIGCTLDSVTVLTLPAGWSEPVQHNAASGNGIVFTSWALGDVASTAFVLSSYSYCHAVCVAFDGRDLTDPLRVVASDNSETGTYPASNVTAPSVTALSTDDIVHILFALNTPATTWAAGPGGYTERVAASPDHCSVLVATKDSVSSGATGSYVRAVGGAEAEYRNRIGFTFAVAGAGAPPPSASVVITNVF